MKAASAKRIGKRNARRIRKLTFACPVGRNQWNYWLILIYLFIHIAPFPDRDKGMKKLSLIQHVDHAYKFSSELKATIHS